MSKAYMTCSFCSLERPISRDVCVTCGRPSYFPNVDDARNEAGALQKRFELERARYAQSDSFLHAIDEVLKETRTVIRCFGSVVDDLSRNLFDVLPTHLQLEAALIRTYRRDDIWEHLRRIASEFFFRGYGDNVNFAALSPGDGGVGVFGPCALVLKGAMVEHRATLFHENSATFLRRILQTTPQSPLPEGYRAVWEDREKLVFAKLAGTLGPDEPYSDVAALLLSPTGEHGGDFVEVHIYGPLSILSLARITGPTSEINRRVSTTIRTSFKDVELVLLTDD